MEQSNFSCFIAPFEFEQELKKELVLKNIKIINEFGRFFVCQKNDVPVVWTDFAMPHAQIFKFNSISEAANKLKTFPVKWFQWSLAHHRRGELILEKLLRAKKKKYNFLEVTPEKFFGCFTLLDNNTLLYCEQTSTKFLDGHMEFNEDKVTPPSRAYLKLWEFFTLTKQFPKTGDRCIDLGSCPGGWTWVLQTLNSEVISVDKAPLAPQIAALKGITFLERNAFTLDPKEVGYIDWLFSDIICYPEKLYDLVKKWRESGLVKNFVCTIKFQAETDFKTMELFEKIEGSKIIHLHHNKHEVTWYNLKAD